MADTIIYHGTNPVWALRTAFMPDVPVQVDTLFPLLGEESGCTEPNRSFTEWVQSKLLPDFEIILDQSADAPRRSVGRPRAHGKVTVETSRIAVASSPEDAKNKLSELRRRGKDGTTIPFNVADKEIKAPKTAREEVDQLIESQKESANAPASAVHEGTNFFEPPSNPALVLDAHGEADTPKTLKEVKAQKQGKGAVVSTGQGVVVMREQQDQAEDIAVNADEAAREHTPGYKKRVIKGSKGSTYKAQLQAKAKKQQFFPSAPTAPKVTANEIVKYGTIKEALGTLKRCKEGRVLRQARTMANNKGDRQLVEAIDAHIANLGPLLQ